MQFFRNSLSYCLQRQTLPLTVVSPSHTLSVSTHLTTGIEQQLIQKEIKDKFFPYNNFLTSSVSAVLIKL